MSPSLANALVTAGGTLLLALLVEARYRVQERRRQAARAEEAGRPLGRETDG